MPRRHTGVCRPELRGQPRYNVIIPSEQTSELSNDSNDDTDTDHESEDKNSEHTITVNTDIYLFHITMPTFSMRAIILGRHKTGTQNSQQKFEGFNKYTAQYTIYSLNCVMG